MGFVKITLNNGDLGDSICIMEKRFHCGDRTPTLEILLFGYSGHWFLCFSILCFLDMEIK